MADEIPDNSIPGIDKDDSGAALDALFKQVTTPEPAKDLEDDETPPKDEPKPDPAPPKDEPKPDPAPPKDTPAPDAKDTPPPKEPPAPPKDALDEVELPPYSKPKTAESFNEVKRRARETISQQEATIKKLETDLAEREEKLKKSLGEDAEKELNDLRNWRRSADIENDATFRQKFDGKIESNNNAIIAKLKEAGMGDEQIAEIKKLGGPDKINWEGLLEKLPVNLRRFIETKLVNNIELKDERQAEIERVRKDPSKFEQERVQVQSKALVDSANTFLKNISWTAIKQVPANATAEEKAKIEADNKVAQAAVDRVQGALKDYSPETFGELAVGTAIAYKLKDDNVALEKALAAEKESSQKVVAERDALKAELEKIKKASRTHRPSTTSPPPPAKDPFKLSGMDALDKLREEQLATV